MKKKTLKTLSSVIIVALICICVYLVLKLYDVNQKLENAQNTTTQTEQKTNNNQEKQEVDAKDSNTNFSVYEESQRGVTIALANFKDIDNYAHQHAIISLDTKYSTDYMYGTYFEQDGIIYIHLSQDIGELRLNGIDGIEISPNSNGGTNVKITINENDGTLKIGNGTLKKII